MPFKGLTWFRLKEHFRKTLWIYIIGVGVMMAVGNLLYTMTAPRTPAEKEVLVYLVDSYTTTEHSAVKKLTADALEYGKQGDETLELVRFESIAYQGIEDYASPMLMTARMSIGDGDIYLCSADGFDYAAKAGMPVDLTPYLAEGWLSELNAEPVYHTYTDEDEGTSRTILAGLRLTNVPKLDEIFMLNNEEAILMVATNSSNTGTSMDVIEHMLYAMMDMEESTETTEETADASADSEEPAA